MSERVVCLHKSLIEITFHNSLIGEVRSVLTAHHEIRGPFHLERHNLGLFLNPCGPFDKTRKKIQCLCILMVKMKKSWPREPFVWFAYFSLITYLINEFVSACFVCYLWGVWSCVTRGVVANLWHAISNESSVIQSSNDNIVLSRYAYNAKVPYCRNKCKHFLLSVPSLRIKKENSH